MGLRILFLLLGGWLMRRGRRWSVQQIAALERGIAAEASIVDIRKEPAGTSHRWVIRYRFQTPEGPQEGEARGWSGVHVRRQVGDPLWVVYLEDAPSQSTLWPPIR